MKVLVATKSVPVFEALRTMPDIDSEPALYSDQVVKLIPSAQLVIVDFGDVVEYPYEIGMIQSLLAEAQEKRGLAWTSSEEFLADPEEWIRRASRSRGGRTLPDKLTVAFTSYSGGVGKTTLALDMALHFARRTERPVLLLEFVYGVSALAALSGLEMPFLYDLTSRIDLQPAAFKGVTLIPMDYDNCRLLPPEEFGKYLKKQMAKHVLTVVDTTWPHGLVRSIQEEVDQWLVVASPRLDATENANKLVKELGAKAAFILNMKRGMGDSLALAGMERELELPYVDRVDEWDGKLGKQLLLYVYGPAWREYESKNIFARLGRYFGRRRSVGQSQA
jgi:hypothetical protein